MAPNRTPFRRSMFGLKTPISRYRRRSNLDDFDGIRSILSRSKVQESWTSHVRQQGDLFYVDVNGSQGSGHIQQQSHHNSGSFHQSNGSLHDSDGSLHHNNGSQNHNDGSNHYYSNRHGERPQNNFYDGKQNGFQTKTGPQRQRINGHIQSSSGNLGSNGYLKNKSKYISQDFDDEYVELDRNDYNSWMSSPQINNKYHNTNHDVINQEHGDKIKHVYLSPNYKNCKNGQMSGIKLCEKMFGIKLCQYNDKTRVNNNNNIVKDRKVIVQAVVPGSAAEKCRQIHRGDMMLGINDMEVSWVNLDKTFNSITNKKVKVTFQVPVVIGPQTPPPVPLPTYKQSLPPKAPPRQEGEDIVQLVTGTTTGVLSSKFKSCLCSFMYLTLEDSSSESENIQDDILYMFPRDDNIATEVRGMFLTLCGVLPDITGSVAQTSTLMYKGQYIHVVYSRYGQDLLAMAMPANRVPLQYLQCIKCELQQVMDLLFSSTSRAFRKPRHKSHLDQLFSLTLNKIFGSDNYNNTPSPSCKALWGSIPGTKSLELSQDNKILCDEILSEFEAADFDDLEEDLPFDRRTFTILGTCLFYKEYLLSNHLSAEDLRDVHLFLKYHCLLHLVSKQNVEELVIWREVFPSRLCRPTLASPVGYDEPSGRWFLLIVGMKSFLLATLLEAGGCARTVDGNPRPDPFYISQAKATLLQLETDDVAMAECCENRLSSERSGPSLASADGLMLGTKPKREESTPSKSQGSPKSPAVTPRLAPESSWPLGSYYVTNRTYIYSHEDQEGDRISHGKGTAYTGSETSTPVMRRQGSKLSYGSNDSGGSGSSTGVSRGNTSKTLSKAGSVFDMVSMNQSLTTVSDENKSVYPIKVTKGVDNVLFHYLNFNGMEGVYVCPTAQEMSTSQGTLHGQVLHNFSTSCLQLRKKFQRCRMKQETTCKHRFGEDNTFRQVQEQGILFQYKPSVAPDAKKVPPAQCYWVIGRRYPGNRELFVCFHESVPQTAIELAFRMDFGS
ncbi:LOW QUALITY PROTEIN: protein inturned-like [Pecten maximus]|uniref:LOW QUALITY PROTEIN: protein inturned-like n=1 Tax=Pecten maximus TaxID=6579 RepID=UPI0014588B1C|nr:LOW QUALITY PROTEIN: protein inturned-like [Pecten maximus]